MSDRPVVTVDPAVRFGYPHINGVSTDAIAGMVWAGENVETVADEYGISQPEVLVACWYEGLHGSRKWRSRWGEWARTAHEEMWRSRFEVPCPPDRDANRCPCDVCRVVL